MKHKVIAYQLICIESGSCCKSASIVEVATKADPKELAPILCQNYNSTLETDSNNANLVESEIEIKPGNMWHKVSTCGDLCYDWQVIRTELEIEVTFPLNHRHEDGVELTFV